MKKPHYNSDKAITQCPECGHAFPLVAEEKGFEPACTDPPRETWPEPPAGCRWGRHGWGLECDAPNGFRLYQERAWWPVAIAGRTNGIADNFYLIAEPLTREERLEAAAQAVCDLLPSRDWDSMRLAKAVIAAWEEGA